VHEEPPRPRRIDPRIPRDLETIILKAIAHAPADRYATPVELSEDLRRFARDEPILARRVNFVERGWRWCRRNPAVAALTTAVFMLLLVVAITSFYSYLQTSNALAAAREAVLQENQAWKNAERNFQRAFAAVDDYLTSVSENELLNQPGMQPLRRELLEHALSYYQAFIGERRDDPLVQRELALAYIRVGRITAAIASVEESRAAYDKGLEQLEIIAEKPPADLVLLAELARAYCERAGLAVSLGANDDAAEDYRRALHLRQTIHQTVPQLQSRIGLAGTLISIGKYARRMGNVDRARETYTQAIGLFNVQEAAADVAVQSLLATAHNNFANALREAGDRKPAMQHYQRALTLREALHHEQPERVSHRRELARINFNLGTVLNSAKQYDRAEQAYETARRFASELEASNPEVGSYKEFHASILYGIGRLRRSQHRPEEARDAYSASLSLYRQLAEADPSVTDHRECLARSHMALGFLHKQEGQHDRAIEEYTRAIAIREELAAAQQNIPYFVSNLARSYDNLATLYSELKQDELAEVWFERSLEKWRALHQLSQDTITHRIGLASLLHDLANFERKRGNSEMALAYINESIQQFGEILARDEANVTAAKQLPNARWIRAETLETLGRYTEAAADWDQARTDRTRADYFTVRYARALAKAGHHERAAVAAEAFLDGSAAAYFNAACIFALNETTRDKDYHAQAVELLQKAAEQGFFEEEEHRENLELDDDLASLRQREDFQSLLNSLLARSEG